VWGVVVCVCVCVRVCVCCGAGKSAGGARRTMRMHVLTAHDTCGGTHTHTPKHTHTHTHTQTHTRTLPCSKPRCSAAASMTFERPLNSTASGVSPEDGRGGAARAPPRGRRHTPSWHTQSAARARTHTHTHTHTHTPHTHTHTHTPVRGTTRGHAASQKPLLKTHPQSRGRKT
jgi:hypothetical protein